MPFEGLAEKFRGMGSGLEKLRTGADLLLHDERASERWRNIGRNVGQRFEQARLGADYFYKENIGSMRWKPFIIVTCVSGVGASVISWSMGSNIELQKRVILSLISGSTLAGCTLLAAVNLNREVHRFASAVRNSLPRGS